MKVESFNTPDRVLIMNYKRKKPRIKGTSNGKCCGGSRTGSAPSWWNIIFHSRPKRRRDKNNCVKVMHGHDQDGLIWDLGNRKPHNYYW
jgi:hypothetical protein